MKKVAREKLKEKNIKWVEAYTDKTAFLKEQYEAVVGPNSYYRFEGVAPDGDEYYCILSPARVHEPIAKWFAGVRKLPATYSAGGKYFDSLDAAAAYALETWGVPTPRDLKPYSAYHLKGISKKIDRWKAAREAEGITEPKDEKGKKDSKYEIKKQSNFKKSISVEAMAREKHARNRPMPEFIVNILDQSGMSKFKQAHPKIASFLEEQAIKYRDLKIKQFLNSVKGNISEEYVRSNTETFISFCPEFGGYIYNVGPYVGDFRDADKGGERVGLRVGGFKRRYKIITQEYLQSKINDIINNENKNYITKDFHSIFDQMIGDNKDISEFKRWIHGDSSILKQIERLNLLIEESELPNKEKYYIDRPSVMDFEPDDFQFKKNGKYYLIDSPELYEEVSEDNPDFKMVLTPKGYSKAKVWSDEFKHYKNVLNDAWRPSFRLDDKKQTQVDPRKDAIKSSEKVENFSDKKGQISDGEYQKNIDNVTISGQKETKRFSPLIGVGNTRQGLENVFKTMVMHYIHDDIKTKGLRDVYFKGYEEELKKRVSENMSSQKEIPSELKIKNIDDFINSKEYDSIVSEVLKEARSSLRNFKKLSEEEKKLGAKNYVLRDVSNKFQNYKNESEKQLGYESLNDAVEALKRKELPATRIDKSRYNVIDPNVDLDSVFTRVNQSSNNLEEEVKEKFKYEEGHMEEEKKTPGLDALESEHDVSMPTLETLNEDQISQRLDEYTKGDHRFYKSLNENDQVEFHRLLENTSSKPIGDSFDETSGMIDVKELDSKEFSNLVKRYENKDPLVLKRLTEPDKEYLDDIIESMEMFREMRAKKQQQNKEMKGEVGVGSPQSPHSPEPPQAPERKEIEDKKDVTEASKELSKILIKESASKNMNKAKNILKKSGKIHFSKKIEKIIKGM